MWSSYVNNTPQRMLLIDAFMAFLVAVGVLQFAYCVLAGNYVRLTVAFTFGPLLLPHMYHAR